MALTQMQLIQSLGEALAWFEREINWGVPATELRHLCGRIGELYVAMITNGQMATQVNQPGYDVVSAAGERISVKTTAQSGYEGHVSFNQDSLALVDRVVVLRVNTEDMQVEILLDKPVDEAQALCLRRQGGRLLLPFRRCIGKPPTSGPPKSINEISYKGYVIKELETGSIEVSFNGIPQVPAKPLLRELATSLNIGLLNSNGNPYNTRQLGTRIIKSVQEIGTVEARPEVPAEAPLFAASPRRHSETSEPGELT